MQVYNTLSRSFQELIPISDNEIKMYVCGLTPYDSAHIGHARTSVSFDVIKRYLLKKGYIVYHIQNITDVDDKIIKRCKETGADPKELTERIHDEALALFSKLNIIPADIYPKVTTHIPEIIELIKKLVDENKAYQTETGVYFDISSFENYGKLSNQDLSQIKDGSRFDVDESKRKPGDFALWKNTKGEILEFDSPFGKGRPGWHIECSAMVLKYGRGMLDIHGGARDLIFPHHENEIAQAEAATNGKYCNCWMHTGLLTVNGEKMSKSLGNFVTIEDALKASKPNTLRLFFLQAHYRSPLDYDIEKINSLDESVQRIFTSYGLILESGNKPNQQDEEFRSNSNRLMDSFYSNLDDDFRTPEALADLFLLLRASNTHISGENVDQEQLNAIIKFLDDALWIFGLEKPSSDLESKSADIIRIAREFGISGDNPEDLLNEIILLRQKFRNEKEFGKSDKIRDMLNSAGITLEDKGKGARWKIQ